MRGDVLVPQDRERDVLVLQLAVDRSPRGLGAPALTARSAGIGEQSRLQRGVGHVGGQRRAQPGRPQAEDFTDLAHRGSLGWHSISPWKNQRGRP